LDLLKAGSCILSTCFAINHYKDPSHDSGRDGHISREEHQQHFKLN